jgi:hypothetical protein
MKENSIKTYVVAGAAYGLTMPNPMIAQILTTGHADRQVL